MLVSISIETLALDMWKRDWAWNKIQLNLLYMGLTHRLGEKPYPYACCEGGKRLGFLP
jgi:hypothetical protein